MLICRALPLELKTIVSSDQLLEMLVEALNPEEMVRLGLQLLLSCEDGTLLGAFHKYIGRCAAQGTVANTSGWLKYHREEMAKRLRIIPSGQHREPTGITSLY